MLNICGVEMRSLDLKFNPLKCHVLRVGKNYDSACNNVLLDNCAIAFEDSITYLGTLIRAIGVPGELTAHLEEDNVSGLSIRYDTIRDAILTCARKPT